MKLHYKKMFICFKLKEKPPRWNFENYLLPLKNISTFSFSIFFLYQVNILQQFIIKYLFLLLRWVYEKFQLERPSRILLMFVIVVMALAENTYTRFP